MPQLKSGEKDFFFQAPHSEISSLVDWIQAIRKDANIPDGDYAFMDVHCADKTCDCRRVFINVLQVHPHYNPGHVATISYGWEPMSFYRTWSRGLSNDILKDFKGPCLDTYQKQSPHAEHFLTFFKNMISTDVAYVNRLKKHYKLFKWRTGMKFPKDMPFDPTMLCPCGSEAKYKFCCGRKTNKQIS